MSNDFNTFLRTLAKIPLHRQRRPRTLFDRIAPSMKLRQPTAQSEMAKKMLLWRERRSERDLLMKLGEGENLVFDTVSWVRKTTVDGGFVLDR